MPAEPLKAKRKTMTALNRRALVNRLWRAAALQVQAHEAHLKALPEGAVLGDADAKALATLARTLRELMLLDAASKGGLNANQSGEADGGADTLETLRAELAQRLGGLVGAGDGDAIAPSGNIAGAPASGSAGAGLADLGPA
ncbi:MAG: hypothetical protein ACRC56_00315 [Bosea sp. (in: a-proteobacteria)]